ncbi:MAG: sigma 54-interacting transcriptional regulator [Candidatus Latescibacteria bacterium]|nr:sigma 54-interacting transcriptional regulator [Candidatus Latescibacterota bacterium]
MPKAYHTTGVWEHFTVQDGLPDMKIECVFEDRNGRLWIGTHDQGVVCYEGGEFNSFSCREGLSGEGVFSILEDRQGKLWLATNRGLTVCDGGGFKSLGLEEPCSFLWGSCMDLEGRLWFGMERQPGRPPMAVRWDGQQLERLELSQQAEEQGQSIHQVICDGEGVVWLGGEGLYRYVGGEGFTDVMVPFLGELVEGLLSCRDGCGLWISTETKLWVYDRNGFKEIFKTPKTQGPVSVLLDPSEGAWLETYDGKLFYYDGETFHLVRGLNTTIRSRLCLDRTGRLWIGTYGMGLYCYDLKRMKVLHAEHGLPADAVLCLAEEKESGELWIGTRRGLTGWDGSTFCHRSDSLLKDDTEISQILEDTCQRLWVATSNGQLLVFKEGGASLFPTSPSLKRFRISSLAEDSKRRIWFGLRFGMGFGYCENNETACFLSQKDAEYPVWIGAIEVDRQGRVWLGSAAPAQWEGLCCYDGATFKHVEGVGQAAILALREDRDGRLWIGTNAGVRCYDGHEFKALTREDGLPCEIVTAILQTTDGTLWFGTEGGGVCRYDGKVCQVIQIPGDQRRNVIHAIHQDRAGRIWLATEGGLVEYTPNELKPEVAVEEVTADQRYAFPVELQVPSSAASIRIRFHGKSPVYPRTSLVYRYRLEGHDPDWRQARERWVEYPQLKAGEYTFAVQVVDRDLNYSTTAQVRLEVRADPRIEALNEVLWKGSGQGEFVGHSRALDKVRAQIQDVASSSLSVLILGETGTGKGLVARAVHELSRSKGGPFIFVNCGTLQGGLVDSELFGHERGAFTGASARKIGKFELAEGGSIFLDEIGDLPLESQVRLLHVLQDRFIERVGGRQLIPIDVRIIAATNRDLKKAVGEGQFRADLYYRLNDFSILVPPLRERKEDLQELAAYFTRRFAAHLDRPTPRLSEEAVEVLRAYDWPGNIRELEHTLQRAVILAKDGFIRPRHIALEPAFEVETIPEELAILPLEEYERRYLRKVLEHTGGMIYGSRGAAALLGLHPNTLRSRMQKLGVRKPRK